MTEQEAAGIPGGLPTKQAAGALKEYRFRVQVSPLDCTGCGNCVAVCPTKEKSLVMKPLAEQQSQQSAFEYLHEKVGYKSSLVDKMQNVKNSQFSQPLFEFSGACAGCGETPYVKLMTQLFGDHMLVANATVARPFTPDRSLRPRTRAMKRVRVRPGATPCSKTMPNSVWECTWEASGCATASNS